MATINAVKEVIRKAGGINSVWKKLIDITVIVTAMKLEFVMILSINDNHTKLFLVCTVYCESFYQTARIIMEQIGAQNIIIKVLFSL